MQFDKVTPQFKSEFDKLVSSANSILITSHKSPDDDSIGCVLSTYYVLSEKYPNKKIEIIYSQEINPRWNYFKNFDKIKTVDDIANIAQNYDLIIFLDNSEYSRFSDLPEKLQATTKNSICIDHHKNKPDDFTIFLKDDNASSCCELLYFLFTKGLEKIPTQLSEIFLLGILGDTGNLEFINPSQAYVFSVVQRLVEDGNIDIQKLKSYYMTYSVRVFKLIQEYSRNLEIKEILGWPPFVTSYLTRKFIEEGKFSKVEVGSAGGVAIQSFGISITEANWVVFVNAKEDGSVGFSLRSRPGSVNVRILMENFGIGSGHDRAAGGIIKPAYDNQLDSQECMEKLFKWMETHQPVLS